MKKNQFCSKKIETSQFVFIRNVQEHTALEAAQHLRKKIENTKNLFWFGAKRQISYDEFVEEIASKSSMSNKDNLVKMSNAIVITSEKWIKKIAEEDATNK
ncbi:MAG: DUF5329 family protein [Halobacteriovoraceae bacterium]|nr:DUF5329 family protein [Halobacteriovoraceae bacterium]